MFCLKVFTLLIFIPGVYSDLTLSSAYLLGVHLKGPGLCSKVFSLTFTMHLAFHPATQGLFFIYFARMLHAVLVTFARAL